MRLTLRTLLSWKDGMLEPEAARDLAARVQSSDKATRIVEKIAEVVARPTLSAAAPDATGFATSANTTAEYLDNVLPADELARFEALCFASEAQLAETGACHAMLADWSRAAVEPLDQRTRRRLLAAVASRLAGPDGRSFPRPRVPAGPRRVERQTARPARAPASAWLLVATAAALVAVLVGALGWTLMPRGRKPGDSGDVAIRVPGREGPPAVAAPAAPPPAVVPAPAAVPPAETQPPPPEAMVPEPVVDPEPPPAPAAPPDDPAAVAEPDPGPPAAADAPLPAAPAAAPAAETRVPNGDALAIAAPPLPAAPIAPPAAGPATAVAPAAAAARSAGGGVLLTRPQGAAADAWIVSAADVALEPPVDLVATPFGRPRIVVDDVGIMLEPGTRAVLSRDTDGTPRLEVVFGGATVVGGKRLGVTAGGLVGEITTGLAAPVGLESRLVREPGSDATLRIARLQPTTGGVGFRRATAGGAPAPAGAAPVLAAGAALVWRSSAPDELSAEPAAVLPDWLAGRQADDRVAALAGRALAQRLAAGTAAVPALRELAGDRRVENRVAAAATLALLGEFAEVASLLVADGPAALPESVWNRLDETAVQTALARGPLAAEAVTTALADRAPPGTADTVTRLARGFGDAELADGAAAELVTALESPHLVVRRYAIKNLVDITAVDRVDRLRYRADWQDESLRAAGADWWRTRLEQGRIVRGAGSAASR